MTTARDLTVRLATLLRREHDAMAEFIVALADFDHRRVWIELGYSSLFYFLVRELGLSKGAAQYRKTAAELVQRVPGIVEPLRDGRLCLTSIVELAPRAGPASILRALQEGGCGGRRRAPARRGAPAARRPDRRLRPGSGSAGRESRVADLSGLPAGRE